MTTEHKITITEWLKSYLKSSNMEGFIIGISGGIDSAITSTLCAETGYPILAVSMPIHQNTLLHNLSKLQLEWLSKNYSNVTTLIVDLSEIFDVFKSTVSSSELGYANSKARLRMTTLYGLASPRKFLVAGTGNKIEDFGVGFFTKYGDGGVDLSPIADLTKTEVYALAKELNIPKEIQEAPPTDGLWDDGRIDEDQLGATYQELEWAMTYIDSNHDYSLTERQQKSLNIFKKHRETNYHKMRSVPVCKLNK
jgi:NAD+ synthase